MVSVQLWTGLRRRLLLHMFQLKLPVQCGHIPIYRGQREIVRSWILAGLGTTHYCHPFSIRWTTGQTMSNLNSNWITMGGKIRSMLFRLDGRTLSEGQITQERDGVQIKCSEKPNDDTTGPARGVTEESQSPQRPFRGCGEPTNHQDIEPWNFKPRFTSMRSDANIISDTILTFDLRLNPVIYSWDNLKLWHH
jgi:hypothetical protein